MGNEAIRHLSHTEEVITVMSELIYSRYIFFLPVYLPSCVVSSVSSLTNSLMPPPVGNSEYLSVNKPASHKRNKPTSCVSASVPVIERQQLDFRMRSCFLKLAPVWPVKLCKKISVLIHSTWHHLTWAADVL